jgi:hypothetical protein
MAIVNDYFLEFEGEQKTILQFFDDLLSRELELTPKMRYGIPFYYRFSWICYLNPSKDGTVELAFPRGNELSNIQGLLQSKGRKQVCSIDFLKYSEIPKQTVHEIIQEAILLDELKPYASKRKNNFG